jgi:hypothetical protein
MHPIWIVFLLVITEQPALEGDGEDPALT